MTAEFLSDSVPRKGQPEQIAESARRRHEPFDLRPLVAAVPAVKATQFEGRVQVTARATVSQPVEHEPTGPVEILTNRGLHLSCAQNSTRSSSILGTPLL